MLQLAFFREQKDRVVEGLKKRNWADDAIENTVNTVLTLDNTRRSTQTELDATLAEIKQLSKKVGDTMKSGNHTEGGILKAQVAELKEKSKTLENTAAETIKALDDLLLSLPNIPNETVPFVKVAEDNEVWFLAQDELPQLADDALPHWEIAQKYPIFDLELGVKLTGAGFPVFRGKGAKLAQTQNH